MILHNGKTKASVLDTQPKTVIGMMSGTSVDAIDACAVTCWLEGGQFHHTLNACHSVPWPTRLRQRLLHAMQAQTLPLKELCELSILVGKHFAQAAQGLLQEPSLKGIPISAIASHGQTLYHLPPNATALEQGYSLQIGEPSFIAEATGLPVISDFRPRDMAAGGHGAPLVCFADALLFQHPDEGRLVQNIGGIGNVTVLPPTSYPSDIIMAFDTGPGNMLMDAAMVQFFQQPYDRHGQTATRGQIHQPLLQALLAHPYLQQAPPKTTGREVFGIPFLKHLQNTWVLPQAEDWIATLTEFTAQSIVSAYERFVFQAAQYKGIAFTQVIVGGGGVHNTYLLKRLAEELALKALTPEVITHQSLGIPDQYKEALAFAMLAWASLEGIPSNLPSCSGAAHPVILGKLTP